MKYKLLFILLISNILFGCTTQSQIKDSLKPYPLANQYTIATILPINLESKKIAECIQEKLKKDLQYLKFFPEDMFRENLFPWFEPDTAPHNIEELSALLSKTLIQKRIEKLGVELLVYVHGYTIKWGEMGFTNEQETHILITVWDLKEIVRVGDSDISFKGRGNFLNIISLPLPFVDIPPFTERNACKETAKRISNCIKGIVSPTDK